LETDITLGSDTTSAPDSIAKDPECELMFNIVYNAADYYKGSADIKQQRIDSLTKAINLILGVQGLNMQNEADLATVTKNGKALSEGDKQLIAELRKEIRKLKRGNWWKGAASVLGIAGAFVLGTII